MFMPARQCRAMVSLSAATMLRTDERGDFKGNRRSGRESRVYLGALAK